VADLASSDDQNISANLGSSDDGKFGGIKFVKISKIEILPAEQVYDISVEGTHNFVAGHFINQETKEALTQEEEAILLDKLNSKFETLNSKQISAQGGSAFSGQNSNVLNSKQECLENWNLGDCDLFRISDLGFRISDENVVFGGIIAHNTYISGNTGIGTTSPWGLLSVNPNGISGPAFAVGSTTKTDFVVTNAGNVGIGTTSPTALLTLDRSSFASTTPIVAGIKEVFTFSLAGAGTQFGNEMYIYNAPTINPNTMVGQMIRVEDNTSLANTVRGLEVQAHRGTNTAGENTGVSSYGRTFGVKAYTTADAGGAYLPAAVYAQTSGTTQGNVLRGYTETLTTAEMAYLYQTTSNFSGIGLRMNFAAAAGTFTGDFAKLQVGGATRFQIDSTGSTTLGELGQTSNKASLTIPYGGICVDNDGWCNASTTGRVSAVSYTTGSADIAENYYSTEPLEAGEIVAVLGGDAIAKASTTQNTIIGVISTEPAIIMSFQNDQPLENQYPVSLSGRIPVKVNLENGPIAIGDRITLSSEPGIGRKARLFEASVGIALEPYADVSQSGLILVFLNLETNLFGLDWVITPIGNFGIGTTTPNYKLQVEGETAALGFINISTQEAKKDINFLTDKEEEEILRKIASTSAATYIYNDEECLEIGSPFGDPISPNFCAKRLGLIAEEAPPEILSVDAKGVDLYKMTSFLWVGMRQLASTTQNLDLRIKNLEELLAVNLPTSDVGNVETSDILKSGFDWVIEQFKNIGIAISDGAIATKEFIAEKITAKKVVTEGIEMKDSATGEIYCVRIVSGELEKAKGSCETSNAPPVTSNEEQISPPSLDTAPPTIILQGNNPAIIQVGSTYRDLGVIVEDNVDQNVGYEVWRNGEYLGRNLSGVEVDTSAAGEHTIEYVAKDQAGNTATSTRTVIVNAISDAAQDAGTATTTATATEPTQ
jgi:hypothetical protein